MEKVNKQDQSAIQTADRRDLATKPRDFQSIRRLPSDRAECSNLLQELNRNFCAEFESMLPPPDLELWRSASIPSEKRLRLLEKFDEFIVDMAGVMGTRVYCNLNALERIYDWEHSDPKGVEKLGKLHKAVILRAKVGRGEESAPVNKPRWYQTKNAMKPELRALLNQLRENFGSRHRAPEFSEIRLYLRRQIESQPDAFPLLARSCTALMQYLTHVETASDQESNTVRKRLRGGNMRPAELFDGWGAWATKHSTPSFRVQVSNAGGRPSGS